MRPILTAVAAGTLLVAGCALPYSVNRVEEIDATDLIPRTTFFGNPDKTAPRISPDGTKLSYLAPVEGVINVWVGPVDDPDQAKPVTFATHRGISNYNWAFTSNHILYIQDEGGDENWRIYSVDLATEKHTTLTPEAGIQARIEHTSPKFPEEILVGMNDRNPQFHDLHKVNISTGERTLVLENPGVLGYVTNDDFEAVMAMKVTPEGITQILQRDGDDWKTFADIGPEDNLTTNPYGLDKTGNILYMIDSRGRDTAALTMVNLTTGEEEVVHSDPRCDVVGAMIHPTKKTIEAVASNYDKVNWTILDEGVRKDVEFLRGQVPGTELSVNSRTQDDLNWIVSYSSDTAPVRYYHFNRKEQTTKFLFSNRPDLDGLSLAKMHPVRIPSRDGLTLMSYLTVPFGTEVTDQYIPTEPLPMVLFVHGGPWARDSWGYHPYHQWLANRGYAVLSVNYRGSTGFGKNFVNAGNFEWAGKMHDDLIDAVNWTVKSGIADEDKVGIMGGSYGGYATLVGLTFTPDTFACGVDIVGPSNLITLFESIPEYWKPMISLFTKRVGDHRTEEGREYLTSRSPISRFDKIEKPLLIGQGANDPRVKQAESDQIVEAMVGKNIPVTYVLYPDEGHGFRRPQNSASFNAVAEGFLGAQLGGRVEPIGNDFEGSSIQVKAGASKVNGVVEALNRSLPRN